MFINAINSCCASNHKYSQRHFKGLIKDSTVAPIIKNMSEEDILELQKVEKRLSRTKFWDMRISKIGNAFKELKFEFIDKKNKHGIITDGIYPYEKHDNTIKVYSIIYGPENISSNVVQTLRYKSSDRAEKVYNKYLQNREALRYRGYNLTPIENIKSKEIELNMLEEAAHFADEQDKLNYLRTNKIIKKEIGNDLK